MGANNEINVVELLQTIIKLQSDIAALVKHNAKLDRSLEFSDETNRRWHAKYKKLQEKHKQKKSSK